jgi:hypothetical protein
MGVFYTFNVLLDNKAESCYIHRQILLFNKGGYHENFEVATRIRR